MIEDDIVAFIEPLEGFEPNVYKDQAGKATIGIGTLWSEGMPTTITYTQAVSYCKENVDVILEFLDAHVTTVLENPQVIALTSFVYNEGRTAFAGSTMLKLINAQEFEKAADQFDLRCIIHVDGEPRIDEGLKNRRAIEKAKFLEGVA